MCYSLAGARRPRSCDLRSIRHLATSALFGAFLAAVAGCGPVDRPPLALYDASSRESHTALLTGRLQLQGPCIVVVDNTGRAFTVAWPDPGAHWDMTTSPTRIGIGGVMASLGSTVTLGGGAANEAGTSTTWNWKQPPAPECLDNLVWVASAIVAVND